MNKRDAIFSSVIDSNALLIDLSNLSAPAEVQNMTVRQIARRHFWKDMASLVYDNGRKVRSGCTIHTYHMISLKPNLWVVSTIELTQAIAKLIVTNHLVKNRKW